MPKRIAHWTALPSFISKAAHRKDGPVLASFIVLAGWTRLTLEGLTNVRTAVSFSPETVRRIIDAPNVKPALIALFNGDREAITQAFDLNIDAFDSILAPIRQDHADALAAAFSAAPDKHVLGVLAEYAAGTKLAPTHKSHINDAMVARMKELGVTQADDATLFDQLLMTSTALIESDVVVGTKFGHGAGMSHIRRMREKLASIVHDTVAASSAGVLFIPKAARGEAQSASHH